jgi:hypothetical protein
MLKSKTKQNILDLRFGLKRYTKNSMLFSLPKDLKAFLYHYNFSKFIECNHQLAKENKNLYDETYANKPIDFFRYETFESKAKLLTVLNDIVKEYENMYLHYWLAGGTLLGMYFFVDNFNFLN